VWSGGIFCNSYSKLLIEPRDLGLIFVDPFLKEHQNNP
jgi:hypothetical protein